MDWEIFSWILILISLAGKVCVIYKKVIGQWLWVVADIGLIAYNVYLGAIGQACLFLIGLGFAFWGISAWSKDARKNKLRAVAE